MFSPTDGLRQLFCQLSMQAVAAGHKSVVERMMLADTKLWKGQWSSDIGSCISDRSVVIFSAVIITGILFNSAY